jgi:hypothetical protein
MAKTYVGRHRREDGVERSPVLALAVLARLMSGSTHVRAASEEAKV